MYSTISSTTVFTGGTWLEIGTPDDGSAAAAIPSILTTSYASYTMFLETNSASTVVSTSYIKKSSDGKTIYWYTDPGRDRYIFNAGGYGYYFLGIK